MRDAITTEPKPAGPPDEPAELAYYLQPDDYVAYWVHLARRGDLPKRAHKAMRDAVGLFWALVWMTSFFLSMLVCALHLPVGLPLVIASAFGLGFAFAFMQSRVDRAPGASFGGWFSKPYRWLCYGALRRLARSESQEGTLDTGSRFRFAMTAEGFTLTTEFAAPRTDGAAVARREDRASWTALEDAAFEEAHVFLTVRKGFAAILPRRCFVGDAEFSRFSALILRHRAEARREPSETGIFTPEDRLTAGARTPFAS